MEYQLNLVTDRDAVLVFEKGDEILRDQKMIAAARGNIQEEAFGNDNDGTTPVDFELSGTAIQMLEQAIFRRNQEIAYLKQLQDAEDEWLDIKARNHEDWASLRLGIIIYSILFISLVAVLFISMILGH